MIARADSPQSKKVTEVKSEDNPQSNPRRAATKLKQMQYHIEMMKNRFKVIEGHDQYQRYKTIDQQKRLMHHESIHQRISKQKEQLKKSLEIVNETADMKERNEHLRKVIKDSIKQARKSVLESRTERVQAISQEQAQNEKRIQQFKQKQLQSNRQKKRMVAFEQQKKKKTIERYQNDKIKRTIMNKSKDTSSLYSKTDNLNEQYKKMMQIQNKLMEENNRSLQASRIMKNKFQTLIPQRRRNQSSKLPQISPKQANGSKTANSDLVPRNS